AIYSVLLSNSSGTTPSSNATLRVLVPQKLGQPVRLPNGLFTVISGDADGGTLLPSDLPNFEAQTSSNMLNWAVLSNSLSLTNGMLLLTDPGTSSYRYRFYRILEH